MAKYEFSPDVFAYELQDILMTYALTNGERIDELSHEAIKTLVKLTRATAPRGKRIAAQQARPHFHTSIAYKKLGPAWFGASRYLWYVKKPNYRLTHLLAKAHYNRFRGGVVPGNPFLQNALDTVLKQYEENIRRYFIE